MFDKPIREEWLPRDHPMPGMSSVAEDGTPIVRLNPTTGLAQDVIVHELFHFVLRDRGYPVVEWKFPVSMKTQSGVFDQLRILLYDPILHHVFYREAQRRVGIDPGETIRRLRGKLLASDAAKNWDDRTFSLQYFSIRLELLDDAALLQQLGRLAEGMGKQEQVKEGERLAEVVLKSSVSSPEGAVAALVACLNRYFRSQFTFEPLPVWYRQLGKHRQRVVSLLLKVGSGGEE